jgi:aminodeoxyfutalosine synthase
MRSRPEPIQDARLRPIRTKVEAGVRLSSADAVLLYETPDLLGVGWLADLANRRKNGDRVFFSANQHLNPTNVCILRKTCVFCSFARMPKEDGAYTRTLEEVYEEAAQAVGGPTSEFHIVGGLHPKLRLSYYTDMIRGLKQRHPLVHIKALTAVEIAHLARIEKSSIRDVLMELKDAGLELGGNLSFSLKEEGRQNYAHGDQYSPPSRTIELVQTEAAKPHVALNASLVEQLYGSRTARLDITV